MTEPHMTEPQMTEPQMTEPQMTRNGVPERPRLREYLRVIPGADGEAPGEPLVLRARPRAAAEIDGPRRIDEVQPQARGQ